VDLTGLISAFTVGGTITNHRLFEFGGLIVNETISRKEFLQRCALVGAAVVGGGSLLAGCGGGDKTDSGGSSQQSTAQTTTTGDPCADTTGLTETDLQMRTTLKYVAESTEAGKNCLNCKFYQVVEGSECGGCQLFKGPVHPKGNCSSWFAKDQG